MRAGQITGTTIGLARLLASMSFGQGAGWRDGHRSWAADNGNGTYSNPLFYGEFSDRWRHIATSWLRRLPERWRPTIQDPPPDRRDGSCFGWKAVDR